MSLRQYQAKRHFKDTPEPRGKTARARGRLRFVVQKHAASRLHYDFRLELDGTLKSWAVPKGPSLDPTDRRLAVMVEDHPLHYRTFEGTIPEGNYGAGTVMVWDQGTYFAQQGATRVESERLLREGLRTGHLRFVLDGQKLRGAFSLVRLRGGKGNNWLLIKKADSWSGTAEVTADSRSARTGRTLDEIAQGGTPKHRPRKAAQPRVAAAKRRSSRKDALPTGVRPMLATLVEAPFDREGWFFEPKWDGYRAIAELDAGKVSLRSRNQKSFNERFAALVRSLEGLGHDAVLDGEIVVLDDRGRSDFQLLQQYLKIGAGRLVYYVFDLLYLDGRDLRTQPLRKRKELLQPLLRGLKDVILSEHIEAQGVQFFAAATAQGLEGIIGKNASSPYQEGRRSSDWVKIKAQNRQEAVIGGFTEPRGSRKHVGALLLGVYAGDELVYIGHTGGGLTAAGLADLRERLEPFEQRRCPFADPPKPNAPVHWLRPRLVCEVKFQEWTDDGVMRQPIFLGLREDKPAREVRREVPRPAAAEPSARTNAEAPVRRAPLMRSADRRVAAQPLRTRPPAAPPVTNVSKVFWPAEGLTKGDLIDYYREVAATILTYLRDRPQSLHRHPNGSTGKSFFQKDVSKLAPPPWIDTIQIRSEADEKTLTYVLCQNEATLLYLANLGCIELNPWNARVGSLDRPDYLIIDLDPVAAPFTQVVQAAHAVRRVLERSGAVGYCKTSGKRGLHICVPLGARYTTEQARQFAEIIAMVAHQELPCTTSLVRSPSQRQGRVYLDYLQNRRGQTLAAPYCVRPYPGATVSTPLAWREVGRRLDPSAFTMATLPRRLARQGDLWAPVLGAGIDLQACLERLTGQQRRSRGKA